ncbi:hypothetical protein ACFE04_004712 [Oxalis oulophora]
MLLDTGSLHGFVLEGTNATKKIELEKLSNLLDDLILDILGRMNTKCATQTSILSKRWTRIWTRLSTLILNSDTEFEHFESYEDVLHSLFDHYDASSLHTCNFSPTEKYWDQELVDVIIDYALPNEIRPFLLFHGLLTLPVPWPWRASLVSSSINSYLISNTISPLIGVFSGLRVYQPL